MRLHEYLRSVTAEERERVAAESNTKVSYLYQLAGGHRNPSISKARLIQRATCNKVALSDWDDVDE